jgi:hypothetical protein
VSESWRTRALHASELARGQSGELLIVIDRLRSVGAEPVILKGFPLAVMLYGDATARPTSDADIFVGSEQRANAHRNLCEAGWRHLYGVEPNEGTYEHAAPALLRHLELHSSLFDEALISHVGVVKPASAGVALGDHVVAAQTGPIVPVFLAVHLAKHARGPLLWWIDFATLWSRLALEERNACRVEASRHRLGHFLDWAERGAFLVERTRSPNIADASAALADLRALHRQHNAIRVASLGATAADKARVAAAWVWPPHLRREPLEYCSSLLRRGRDAMRRAARRLVRPKHRASRAVEQNSVVSVDRQTLINTVEMAVAMGSGIWIRVKGNSMAPAIPRGCDVRLVPSDASGIEKGSVVFAVSSKGTPILHRVKAIRAGHVILKGDNLILSDAPVPISGVLAFANAVRIRGEDIPLERRPRYSWRLFAARWRVHLWRRFLHA